jgi:hypothetical protein
VTVFAEAVAEVRRLHGGRLTRIEEGLLALAFLDGQPLRAGSDVVDARALVRARLMVELGMGAREALAWARQSDGEAGVSLDDALRITGLRSVYVDPYVVDREEGEGWARSGTPPGYWVCDPCGDSARTLISLREPRCPFCGRKYQDELRSTAPQLLDSKEDA